MEVTQSEVELKAINDRHATIGMVNDAFSHANLVEKKQFLTRIIYFVQSCSQYRSYIYSYRIMIRSYRQKVMINSRGRAVHEVVFC